MKLAESHRTEPAPDNTAYPPLLTSLSVLVERMRMLTGMAVAYGNRDRFFHAHVGNVQEVELAGGIFVPRVRPVRDSTLYDLASLTKIFTMIGVMQLVSSGEISLDDRIGGIDPRFPGLAQVRLEQAMSYEAPLQTPERIDTQPDYEAALHQVFAMVVNPTESPRPYSDMNALALKYVVERVSGMPFFDYIERHILRPAGMTETYSLVPPDRLGDCACYNYEHRILRHEYRMRSDIPLGVPHDPKAQILRRDGLDLCGHAGLFSTLPDMARLCQALLSGKLLPMDTVLRLSTDRRRNANPNGGFRQYLGMLCFIKGPQQRYSEVPSWMSGHAFAQSGYTGNH
ncbi:MAG TPA: serine hydrolase domain-containing protein, partial [Clostridia bacterium]|nr:serine hydrolase domain-containing protein [Clostridia bacterium]